MNSNYHKSNKNDKDLSKKNEICDEAVEFVKESRVNHKRKHKDHHKNDKMSRNEYRYQ